MVIAQSYFTSSKRYVKNLRKVQLNCVFSSHVYVEIKCFFYWRCVLHHNSQPLHTLTVHIMVMFAAGFVF